MLQWRRYLLCDTEACACNEERGAQGWSEGIEVAKIVVAPAAEDEVGAAKATSR